MGVPKQYPSKIAANGQVVIPKELRETLGLKGGDTVLFYAEEQQAGIFKVVLRKPTLSFKAMVGAFKELEGRPWREILKQIDDEEAT